MRYPVLFDDAPACGAIDEPTPGAGSGGVMSERLYTPLKMLSYAVLVLMFGAIAYAFAISLLYWSGINV